MLSFLSDFYEITKRFSPGPPFYLAVDLVTDRFVFLIDSTFSVVLFLKRKANTSLFLVHCFVENMLKTCRPSGPVTRFCKKSFLLVDFWCVHPGGRRIIEEAQNGLGLTEEQTADSWAVLAEYGNMLSPSVMFVLSR